MWRAAFVPAFYRVQSATGRNAPPFQRVNGPIRHIDAWYKAFGVSPGDKMYVEPNKRVRFLF
jgi:predicted metalloendopeptidase